MKVQAISAIELARQLAGSGIHLRIGPFVTHLSAPIPAVASNLHVFYRDHTLEDSNGIADFHIRMACPKGLRRWFRPQVMFYLDGQTQFQPFPYDLAPPLLEWGLNWCISTRAHQYLILHAAVAERDGRAVIFPARPGSGKSTLCAGLVHQGWRLLSDEHALIRPEDGTIARCLAPLR